MTQEAHHSSAWEPARHMMCTPQSADAPLLDLRHPGGGPPQSYLSPDNGAQCLTRVVLGQNMMAADTYMSIAGCCRCIRAE
jgi:hypothetical protein